jgi:LPPG:FO 2-phospho-L-lactate transferase
MDQEQMSQPVTVAVLCGGVGAARYLLGLTALGIEAHQISAIVNTGDDTELHGLHISPDLDTITYTLAGAIDPERGWGLAGETWTAMQALGRYVTVRPDGSAAAPDWFNLGDRDLATHFYRTARLGEGASLTQVTGEIARAWEIPIDVLPMSDDPFATLIDTTEHGLIPFQEYFVRHRHALSVREVVFGHANAQLSPAARGALQAASHIVIAPSNPLVSIGPIRALDGVDELLATRRESVVAVSPIVGGVALKGPAAEMMTALGHEPSVVGVAGIYCTLAGTLVIDHADEHLADRVEATGMRCIVTDTVMSTPAISAELARRTLSPGE